MDGRGFHESFGVGVILCNIVETTPLNTNPEVVCPNRKVTLVVALRRPNTAARRSAVVWATSRRGYPSSSTSRAVRAVGVWVDKDER